MTMNSYRMVDVSDKPVTSRRATAWGVIELGPKAFPLVRDRSLPKGDALALAEIAGIMAAKNAHQSIPLCHPLGLDHVRVGFQLDPDRQAVGVCCTAATSARTGVEMEALAGVSGALLALYDLAKNVDPVLRIGEIRLLEKSGGKSGTWRHPAGLPALCARAHGPGGRKPCEQSK
ncbi:MAG: cyclic pyranopterin monophosphate synthase MoaC [Gammaproteobacteria bacterium]|jgi:molybdenum cofactor biosynthesis protein MoaC